MPGRSVWALITPKHHQYYFAFVDKSKGSQHDELLMLFRKHLKAKGIPNYEGEKISIDHFNSEKEAA